MAENARPDPHQDFGGKEGRTKHDDRAVAAAAEVRSGHESDPEPPRAKTEIDRTPLRERFDVKADTR
ncbi:MAG: hypothetical protein QOJ63_934 [Solirubrobacteraceae bacterium]|jgi:hypothetical protein|nr:hypothetical protein [Solirubrobacteraceae bacterium]